MNHYTNKHVYFDMHNMNLSIIKYVGHPDSIQQLGWQPCQYVNKDCRRNLQ